MGKRGRPKKEKISEEKIEEIFKEKKEEKKIDHLKMDDDLKKHKKFDKFK